MSDAEEQRELLLGALAAVAGLVLAALALCA